MGCRLSEGHCMDIQWIHLGHVSHLDHHIQPDPAVLVRYPWFVLEQQESLGVSLYLSARSRVLAHFPSCKPDRMRAPVPSQQHRSPHDPSLRNETVSGAGCCCCCLSCCCPLCGGEPAHVHCGPAALTARSFLCSAATQTCCRHGQNCHITERDGR